MIWPDAAPARPLWLVTLADLALLLVGFFVLIQATQNPRGVATSLRAGFATDPPPASQPAPPPPALPPPLPVAAEGISGFAAGSAALPAGAAALRAWAADQLRDPRVALTVTGSIDGSAADVDPATRSPSLLAADRARAVAALLAPLAPARVTLATGTGRRGVIVTLAFAGERKMP